MDVREMGMCQGLVRLLIVTSDFLHLRLGL